MIKPFPIINIVVSLALIIGLLPYSSIADDRKESRSVFLPSSDRAPGYPIGTVETIGSIRIDGRSVIGKERLFGGETIQTPGNISARVILDSTGVVTILPGSIVRVAEANNASQSKFGRTLIASIVEGEISVELHKYSGAYLEAAGKVFLASEGSGFSIGYRGRSFAADVMKGELVESGSLYKGKGEMQRVEFKLLDKNQPSVPFDIKNTNNKAAPTQRKFGWKTIVTIITNPRSLWSHVPSIRRDAMFIPAGFRLNDTYLQDQVDNVVEFKFEPTGGGIIPGTFEKSAGHDFSYDPATGIAAVSTVSNGSHETAEIVFTAVSSKASGDLMIRAGTDCDWNSCEYPNIAKDRVCCRKFKVQVVPPFFTTPMKLMFAAAIGLGVGLGTVILKEEDKSIKPLPPPVITP